MKFDLYMPLKTAKGFCPGVHPVRCTISEIREKMHGLEAIISRVRSGDRDAKKELPAVCWVGRCDGRRAANNMTPTGWVMVDIDHCEDAVLKWGSIYEEHKSLITSIVGIAHVTPSGKGLRIVFQSVEGLATLKENMEWLNDKLRLSDAGDFDVAVKDYSRLSFLSLESDILYINEALLESDFSTDLVKYDKEDDKKEDTRQLSAFEGQLSEDELQKAQDFEYRGTPVKVIIEKYVNTIGEPSSGEVHNYYNNLVKNFRNICNNDKRVLLALLPRFGHSVEECWSQIKSICKSNTLSSLPKEFYFFLKDNGYYQPRESSQMPFRKYMMGDGEDEHVSLPPYLPPVFRELVRTAPRDFVVPCINALLPILGTLTSYAGAVYPYDGRVHTTSFFSVIYAPPGTGKGFVERFLDLLFEDLKLRDLVQSERENVYLRTMNKKGANDKAPDAPHTSLRIIPAKNSEAEFLQKQRDNHGYHMFTYAAEMDSWAKGVKAAGGNKDDMIRIAWDNGEYGQQFKSYNTFKGIVKLYWNVLITGTLQQVESYFKNVENGLVTRCCFTSIDNQEFVQAPKWKKLSSAAIENIRRFTMKCDENSYMSPCSVSPVDLECVSDEDFDKSIDWRFEFKERQNVDISWIMPTIDAFEDRHMSRAALDLDRARDVFRRRVGVRGFRLALLCSCLYNRMTSKDKERCSLFVDWWMERDIESMLKLWGAKYNEQSEVIPKISQRSLYSSLGKTFSKGDVYASCVKQGIKTTVRRILFDWKKLGAIKVLENDQYEKLK